MRATHTPTFHLTPTQTTTYSIVTPNTPLKWFPRRGSAGSVAPLRGILQTAETRSTAGNTCHTTTTLKLPPVSPLRIPIIPFPPKALRSFNSPSNNSDLTEAAQALFPQNRIPYAIFLLLLWVLYIVSMHIFVFSFIILYFSLLYYGRRRSNANRYLPRDKNASRRAAK